MRSHRETVKDFSERDSEKFQIPLPAHTFAPFGRPPIDPRHNMNTQIRAKPTGKIREENLFFQPRTARKTRKISFRAFRVFRCSSFGYGFAAPGCFVTLVVENIRSTFRG
jgi:hypothetical protein